MRRRSSVGMRRRCLGCERVCKSLAPLFERIHWSAKEITIFDQADSAEMWHVVDCLPRWSWHRRCIGHWKMALWPGCIVPRASGNHQNRHRDWIPTVSRGSRLTMRVLFGPAPGYFLLSAQAQGFERRFDVCRTKGVWQHWRYMSKATADFSTSPEGDPCPSEAAFISPARPLGHGRQKRTSSSRIRFFVPAGRWPRWARSGPIHLTGMMGGSRRSLDQARVRINHRLKHSPDVPRR